MKAMVLAAGLGTRLRPLTDRCPKALVSLGGRTLLEITLSRLHVFGVREVIVNVHHHADMIVDYLEKHNNFGMQIEISREQTLLDTGGGLKKAAHFFLRDPSHGESCFILHNVDVISTIDLGRMVQWHGENQTLATLAVQDRRTSRPLLFDRKFQLGGRGSEHTSRDEMTHAAHGMRPLAFSGIHVISSRLLSMLSEQDAFSIITAYLRLAAGGEKILGFPADEYYWRDLGTPRNLAEAAQDVKQDAILRESWEKDRRELTEHN